MAADAVRNRTVRLGRRGAIFAGVLMLVVGIFQAIAGITAIANDDFYVVTENYVFDLDASAWGWIHLILGVLVAIACWSLIAGKVGGLAAIALATLSAIANFFMIPYYPFWSIVIIAICMWVIWAVTRPSSSDS